MSNELDVYPWCRLGSHDYVITRGRGTIYGRGLCRVAVEGREPCSCSCHESSTQPASWGMAIKHYDSLRSYEPGPPAQPLHAHRLGWWRDLVGGALPRSLRPAVAEENIFPIPEEWTWEDLEDQACLKDMRFRYVTDYPRRAFFLRHVGEPFDTALDGHRAVWDFLRRIVLREGDLEALVAEWLPMRSWRMVAVGPPVLAFDSTVGFKWAQNLALHKSGG